MDFDMECLKVKNRVKTIVEIVKNSFLNTILILILVLFCVFKITHTKPLFIMSPSMEPTIMTHTFVLGKEVNPEEEMQIGGVYLYKNPEKPYTITHRIVDKENGFYIFKGDNNKLEDAPVDRNWIKYKIIWYKNMKKEKI